MTDLPSVPRCVRLCVKNGGRVEANRNKQDRGCKRFRAACWKAVSDGWLMPVPEEFTRYRFVFAINPALEQGENN